MGTARGALFAAVCGAVSGWLPGETRLLPFAVMIEPLGLAKCQSFPVKFSYQGGGPGFGLPSRHGWEPRSKSTKARSTICPHQVRSFFKTWPRYPEPPVGPG